MDGGPGRGGGGVLPALAQDDAWAKHETIGRSHRGQAIELVTLAKPGEDALGRAPNERPALLIVAGADGRHAIGREAAEAVGARLLAEHRELLESYTVYIVSSLNPDGAAWLAGEQGPRMDFGRNAAQVDADHDGRIGEDGADDINADGMITMMRQSSTRRPSTGSRPSG